MFERIDTAVTRMRLLINDRLTYSKVSSQPNTFEPLDLHNLMNEVINDLEASIKEKEAVVSLNSLPVLMGDKGQLRLLFQN